MTDYPRAIASVDQREPVPRRVRATLGGRTVLDTTRALYVWEWPPYPQFYIPIEDVDGDVLVDEDHVQKLSRGTARRQGLRVGDTEHKAAARVYTDGSLRGYARFEWDALDAWFEEDEQVFVHPRNPYSRVDALRSTRPIRVELEGVLLAESAAPVLLFETGLPTRYYLDRTAVNFGALERTDTMTACPYKGRTTDYWSIRTPGGLHADLAWSYAFPTAGLSAIAGLVAFYNEKVDITLDGRPLDRPDTHFFKK
jgi:uncharacterized protein (DUF427 family)